MRDEKIEKAIGDHERWIKVWYLVEKLDGEIRYSSDRYQGLLADSKALAEIVKPAVAASQEALNDALLGSGKP